MTQKNKKGKNDWFTATEAASLSPPVFCSQANLILIIYQKGYRGLPETYNNVTAFEKPVLIFL